MADDRGAIIDIINRYGLAIDSFSWDLFDSIFTSDVVADYGTRVWHDLPSFKTDFARSHAHLDVTQHAMLSHQVKVATDTAQAFTYVSWRLIARGREGGDFLTGTAWYDDSLVRTARGWLIKRRDCRLLWWEGNVMVTQIPGQKLGEFQGSTSLRKEVSSGKLAYIKAIRS